MNIRIRVKRASWYACVRDWHAYSRISPNRRYDSLCWLITDGIEYRRVVHWAEGRFTKRMVASHDGFGMTPNCCCLKEEEEE